jgi:hypothetical protein
MAETGGKQLRRVKALMAKRYRSYCAEQQLIHTKKEQESLYSLCSSVAEKGKTSHAAYSKLISRICQPFNIVFLSQQISEQ